MDRVQDTESSHVGGYVSAPPDDGIAVDETGDKVRVDTTLTDNELELRIRGLSASIDAATCELMKLIVEFDERGCWCEAGFRSCAHWLSSYCGLALRAARERLRVGRALQELPKVQAAFEDGSLSYSKARAITRVADEHSQDYLLSIARYGSASHVERLISSYRGSIGRLERDADRRRGADMADHRNVSCHYDENGMLLVRARLPPEQGALLVKALDLSVEELDADRPVDAYDPHGDVSAETSADRFRGEIREARIGAQRADALCSLASNFLQRRPRGKMSSGDRHHVTVIVDEATLVSPAAASGIDEHTVDTRLQTNAEATGADAGMDSLPDLNPVTRRAECHVPHGPQLPADTVRRLCCDGPISGMLERDGKALSIGRRSRSIPPSMRRAMLRRDGGCRFPGCSAHRFVDGHHIQHWADGGETSLDNLVTCCTHHHRLLHEGGYQVARSSDGDFIFTRPDGRVIDDPPAPLTPEERWPMPQTAASEWGWDGSRIDWCMALGGLQELNGYPDRYY